jgi:hypothetical protein
VASSVEEDSMTKLIDDAARLGAEAGAP